MSSSTRGRGGKFQKPKRGGGKHFSRDLRPLDAEGFEKSIWASESSNSGSESASESSSDEEPAAAPAGAAFGNTPEPTREERRAAAKARKQAAIKRKTGPAQPGDLPPSDSESDSDEADMPANPNHTAKARAQTAVVPRDAPSPDAAAAPKKVVDDGNLSRREKEALQAAQARERYQKLQAAGKTEEARSDLERLKLVRQKREEEAARKEAERQEREEHEKAKAEQMAREERMRALAAGKKGRAKKN